MMSTDDLRDKTLREMKVTRGKYIRFAGETSDGEHVVWYATYNGKFGWTARRSDGSFRDEPDEDEIREAFDVFDTVEIVDGLPEGAT